MTTRPVYLAATGAVTACGRGGAPTLSALMAGLVAADPHALVRQRNGEGGMEPVSYAPIRDLAPLSVVARIEQLFSDVLDDIAPALPGEPDAGQVMLVLPAAERPWLESLARSERTLTDIARECLAGRGHRVPTITVRRARSAEVLSQAVAEVAEGRADWMLVVSADSLLDLEDLGSLAASGILQTATREGLVPGEGAAAVLLTNGRGEQRGLRLHTPSGFGSAETTAGATKASTELAPVIAESIGAADLSCDDVGAVFLATDPGAEQELQWWRTRQRLWPARLPEESREAVEVGALDAAEPESNAPPRLTAAAAIGGCGEATLPILLAMAHAWTLNQRQWSIFDLASGAPAAIVCESRHGHAPWAVSLTSEQPPGRE